MKIQELLEDDSWLDIAKDKLSSIGKFIAYGPQDKMNDYYLESHLLLNQKPLVYF